MVRPGLKRLQEAQRVKVQPNKTGTSAMLGRAGLFNRSAKNVVFSSVASTPYNNLAFSKDFEQEYNGLIEDIKADKKRKVEAYLNETHG